MKKKYDFSGKRFFIILLCLAFAINPSLGFCLPEGESVVSGQAAFDRSQDNTLNINTPSENLIVNYDSFSIAQPEAVHFFQPSSSAIALNRVVGADPSAIYGILTANGRIFLINPNGVLFGQGARVDAAGLVASTLDISNENFLSGNYNFFKNGLNSFIVNQGQITMTNGGYAFLLSQGIDNQGSIKAGLGKVVLASGEKMTLALDDLSEISVVLDEAVKNEVFGASGEKIDSTVKNSGTITADGGKVTLTAKALNTVFDYAINNTGVIQANSLVSNNGVVELLSEGAPIINIGKVAADGSIEAPNAGKVSIVAPEVIQQGQVTANAEEAGKAGEISIVSSNQTTLGAGSSTEAKAQGSAGEGGNILIDSTAGNTAVNTGAVIDVSAGSQAGNAGSVEVSALKVLNFDGMINGNAPVGYLGGVAILDPTDATISGTLNLNTTVWATNDITITNTVRINGNFTLNLFADHHSATAGDWEDGIGEILNPNDRRIEAADGTDTTLNLKAGSGIGMDNSITTRKVHTITAEINPDFGAGDINLVSDSADVSLRLAGLFTPMGNISVENRNNVAIIIDRLSPDPVFSFAIETDNGSVTIANVGPIDIPGTNSDGIFATGDITLITTDGNADITADTDNTFAAIWSIDGNITLDAGNNISLGQVSGVNLFADSGNISMAAGNDINVINGTLINAVLGNIELAADNNIDLGLLEALGVVTLTAGGQVSDNNGIDNNIAANDLFVTGVLGIDLDTAINTLTAVSADSDITINEADNLAVDTIDAGAGNVTLSLASGAITDNNLDANNVTAGGLSLSAPLGIDLDTQVATLTASTTDNDITIREADDVVINTINAGTANVDLSSNLGAITDANAALNNITANNLILTANSDIDLDTDVATLDAIAGSLTIDEFDAITLNALEIFGGDINITADGTITTVDLFATDANGNIFLTANTGDILVDTIEAGNTVGLTASLGQIVDNNGVDNNIISANLIAQGANGIDLDTLVDTLSASTTNADIAIREIDDVALNTINAGTANVDLSSASGAITDNNGDLNNVSANTLTLTTETGIDFDTTVNSLDAIITGTGNLAIDEADDIILTTLDTIDGNIAVTAQGAITALELMASDLSGIGGDISLSSETGDINVDLLTADNTIDLSAASGAIVDLNAGNNNILSNSLILTANSGVDLDTTINSLDAIVTGIGDIAIDELDSITLTALDIINGNININAGDTITALDLVASDIDADGIGGNIFLTASAGDLSLGTLSADYTVELLASLGAITDNNVGANNVTADELILSANSGINLDSAVNFLNAQAALGNIDISNDTVLLTIDDFSLGNLVGVTTDDGSITISNTGSIDLPGTNGDGIYATGDIALTSSGGSITAGSEDWITAVWSDNGSIALNADSDIYLGEIFTADLLISNGIGSINLTTTSGDITIDNGTNINSIAGDITLTSGNDINLLETLQGGTLIISDASGNITLDAANNISLGVLQTAGDVSLTAASGAITDNNDIDNNITANNLILTANSGADLDTNVTTLDAMITGNGDLAIEEFDAIELISLDLVGGSADITAGSSIAADSLLNLDSDGNIILTALTGDITIGSIEAGGSIILTAALGAINEIGLGDADVDLTASIINLFAQEEIGSALDELDIETDTDILIAESTNAKDIVITEANDVAIEAITTGGDVYISSLLGSITDANAALNNITANNLFLTAADDVDLDTNVNILDAIIGDNLTIREADDISLYAIDVLGGNVNISVGNILTITNSLLTNGGELILSAANGIMQEQLGDIDTTAGEGIGAGSYTANADANNDYIGAYALASGGSIYTQDIDGSGEVEITAADIDLGSGSLIAAGDRDITLVPSFDGITPLTIGLGNAAGDFTLNNDELDSILTSGTVIIGDDNSGNILVREVAPLGFSDLMLITGGNINDIAGQLGIAISRLRLEAVSGIGEIGNPLNINVDILNASTDLGSIFIDEEDDIGLEQLTAPDSIQLNANGEIDDDNADLININTLDLLITAGNGIGELADAIETEIETLEAYAANGGIFINEADDLHLNLVNAEDDDVMLSAGGSILDNDLGAAPDDFDILGANITLYVGGHIGSSREEEEVDLDLDSLVSLTENSRPDAPTDLNSLSHILGTWSNNNLVDVSWTPAINPNYYTGSDNSIAGYSFVWDNAAGTIPDEIQDIGDITSLDDILLGDSASNYLHIRSLNSSGNWSGSVHLGSFKIDTVAPIISATRNSGPNINGWYNSDVTVSFDGIDELSGIDSITAPIIISSEGQGQSAAGTVTDLAGNSAQITEDNINIDKTAPVISSSRDIHSNENGWNNSDVTVSFAGSDGLSGVDSITGPILISTEGLNQSVIGTITDLAGNSVSISEDNINIDKTAPTILANRNVGPNANGWNNSDVTVNFDGADGLSGVDSVTGPILFSLEGANQSASGTVTDLAGNSASVTETGINIDKTLPVISVTTPINGAVVANQQVLSFGVSDNLTAAPLLTGPASGTVFNDAGTQNILITATDLAGNISEELLTFTITSDFLESQLANAAIINPFFFTNLQATGQFQVSSFDSVGSVFFYHPLTPVDMSAFEGMAIEEEVCDFIDGTLCVKSKDESSGSKDVKKEDKKKEKK